MKEIKKLNSLYSMGLLSILSSSILAADIYSSDLIIKEEGRITSATVPAENDLPDGSSLDYKNVKSKQPMVPSPTSINPQSTPNTVPFFEGKPEISTGGTGKESPTKVPKSDYFNQQDGMVPQGSSPYIPQNYGTTFHPFSTARVANQKSASATTQDKTYKSYPYSAVGRLIYKDGPDTYGCSAALIKPGIIVTAAHCVVEFGSGRFYTDWEFTPAYHIGKAPFGKWYGSSVFVLSSYAHGTDNCTTEAVVCENDVAVMMVSNKKRKKFPGTKTGWFSYGVNGYGYTPGGVTHISQLGYPLSHDSGEQMQRNDSYGYIDTDKVSNTIIGSLMTGVSSGGPWVVNLGSPPSLSGTSAGLAPASNVIVGVTSWGSTDSSLKEQGASPFTSSNIVALVNAICASVPAGACS